MSEAVIDYYLAEHASRAPMSSLPWLREQQQAAVEVFGRTGFPTLRHEEWKYTDVRSITKRRFAIPGERGQRPDPAWLDLLRFSDLDCLELVFSNGFHVPELSATGTPEQGIVMKPLARVLAEEPDRLQPYLNRVTDPAKNGFVALNTAFINDGAVLVVPDNVTLDKPVHLLFLCTGEACACLPRNLIVLGENAVATVIESYVGVDGAEYFTDANTETILGRGARLEHYRIQNEGSEGFHVGNLQAQQQCDSRLESHAIALGGRLSRLDIDIKLAEPGASTLLNGLYLAGGRQHVDNHTRIDHLSPRTTSEEYYRGVLDGRARGVFNGKVVVHKDAQKTDAAQSNANLLLSNDAEVDTKPELEIYADDVKCSHGASTGRLDEDMLFYLRSRAVPEDTARSLLTFAFAEDVITRLRLEPIRDRLEYIVVGRLPDADLIREFLE